MYKILLFGVLIVSAAASKTERSVEKLKYDSPLIDTDNILDQPYCGIRYRRLCHGKGQHIACQFPTEWDKELAMLAQRLADQCNFVHDGCRATVRYPYAGQTVGEVKWRLTGNSDQQNIASAIRRVLDAWWGERRRVTVEQLTQPFRLTNKGNIWGHFSQIAVWTLRAVGCGMVRHGSQHHLILMVCDFSHTNMLGQRTIVPGRLAPCPIHTTRRIHSSFPLLCLPVRFSKSRDDEKEEEDENHNHESDDEDAMYELDNSEDSVTMPITVAINERQWLAKMHDKVGFEEPRKELLTTWKDGYRSRVYQGTMAHSKTSPNFEEDFNDIEKNNEPTKLISDSRTTPDGDEDYSDDKQSEYVRQKVLEVKAKSSRNPAMLKKLDQELYKHDRHHNDQFRQIEGREEEERPTVWKSKHVTGQDTAIVMSKLMEKQRKFTIDKLYQPVGHRWRPHMPLPSTYTPKWRLASESKPRSFVKEIANYAKGAEDKDVFTLRATLSTTADDEAFTYSRTRWRAYKAHSPRPGAKALPGITLEHIQPEVPMKEMNASRVVLKMPQEDIQQLFEDTGFKPSE